MKENCDIVLIDVDLWTLTLLTTAVSGFAEHMVLSKTVLSYNFVAMNAATLLFLWRYTCYQLSFLEGVGRGWMVNSPYSKVILLSWC